MDLPVVPPLSGDTDWIEVIAAGRSAEVRARCRSAGSNLIPNERVSRPADGPGYLMATALAGEPIPPGAFSGALARNIS